MKLGQVSKLDTRNKTTLKEFDYNAMSKNCDVIAIFPIYDQFGAICKLNSVRIACKTYISTNSNLYFTKTAIALSKGIILAEKRYFFAKNAEISKSNRAFVTKRYIF